MHIPDQIRHAHDLLEGLAGRAPYMSLFYRLKILQQRTFYKQIIQVLDLTVNGTVVDQVIGVFGRSVKLLICILTVDKALSGSPRSENRYSPPAIWIILLM